MGVTVKGVPASPTQVALINQVLGIASSLKAPRLAVQALLEACIQENDFTNNPGGGGTSSGLLQLLTSTAAGLGISQLDVNACVTAFLTKGFYGHGGAIAQAQANPAQEACVIAQNTQGSAFPTAYCQWLNEANAMIAAYGGGSIKGGVAGLGGTGTVANASPSSTYQFQIGGTNNPDEDFWTGINRLAQEVNWYLFSNGELLYYMDGAEMIAQTPALILDRVNDGAQIKSLSGTYDNTAFQYVSSHQRKFKVQRKAKLVQVTSPTEVQLELFCGIDEIRAGDVIELSSFGMLDGAWIVGTCLRSVFEPSSTLTLVPPIAPVSEAAVAGATGKSQTAAGSTSTAAKGPGGVALSGSLRAKVVQVANAAIARQASSHAFQYSEVRPYPASLSGPAPIITDCSGFSILCYKDAGAPDPNGTGFNGQGFTGSLIQKGTPVTTPQPADLIFYNTVGINSHVAVYLGNDRIANMGSPGEPVEESLNAPGPIYGMRSYL